MDDFTDTLKGQILRLFSHSEPHGQWVRCRGDRSHLAGPLHAGVFGRNGRRHHGHDALR